MTPTQSLSGDQPATRGRLIYYVHVAGAVIFLPVLAFLWVDLALHPTEITPGFGVGLGLIIGLGNSLFTLVIGVLCLRRSVGNPIGAILILWAVTSIAIAHPSPDVAWINAYTNLFGGFVLVAFFLMFSSFPAGHVFPRRFERWIECGGLAP